MRMLCYFLRWLQEWDDQSVSSRADISPVPSSLSRWTEEAKLLDGESVHHLVASLKPELEEELKKYRQVEFLERKQRLLAEKKEADKNKPPPAFPGMEETPNSSVGSRADLSQTSSMDSAENGEVTRAFVSAMLGLTSSSNSQQTGRETLNAAASVVADEIVQASLSSAVTAAEATVAATATTSSEVTTSPSETMVENSSGGGDSRSKRQFPVYFEVIPQWELRATNLVGD